MCLGAIESKTTHGIRGVMVSDHWVPHTDTPAHLQPLTALLTEQCSNSTVEVLGSPAAAASNLVSSLVTATTELQARCQVQLFYLIPTEDHIRGRCQDPPGLQNRKLRPQEAAEPHDITLLGPATHLGSGGPLCGRRSGSGFSRALQGAGSDWSGGRRFG